MTLKSPARRWMSVWVHLGWLPVAVLARFWDWAAETPGRFSAAVVVAVTMTTCLNAIPVVGWVIPDGLSVMSWLPLSWIGDQ